MAINSDFKHFSRASIRIYLPRERDTSLVHPTGKKKREEMKAYEKSGKAEKRLNSKWRACVSMVCVRVLEDGLNVVRVQVHKAQYESEKEEGSMARNKNKYMTSVI